MGGIRYSETKPSPSLIKHSVIGGLFGIVIGLIVLLVLSALIAFTNVPESMGGIFVLIAAAAGALAAGIYAAHRINRRGLVAGVLSGIIFFVLMIVIGLIIGDGDFTGKGVLTRLLVSVIAGGIGGIIGVGRPRVR